jgi:hypothetical protein
MSIYLADYDSKWPGMFEAEAQRLRAALGGLVLRIDHIGSTAVPGLAAKPVIDVHRSLLRICSPSSHMERRSKLGISRFGALSETGSAIFLERFGLKRRDSHSATRTRLCRFPFSTDLPSGPTRIMYTCARPEALTNRERSRFAIGFGVTQRIDGLMKHSSEHWRATWMRRPWKAVSAIRRRRRTSFGKSSDAPDLQKRGGLSYNRNRFGFWVT